MDDPGWCWILAANVDFRWWWFFSLLLIILTLFFSTTNLALRHAAWAKLQEAFEKRGQSDRTQLLRERLPGLVSCTATLRLLTNLALVLTVINYYSSVGLPGSPTSGWPVVLVFVVSGLLLSVFSVAIPQAWAKYAGMPLLAVCYPVLYALEWFCWPLTTVMNLFDPLIRRLAGVAPDSTNGTNEERQEELFDAVVEGEKGGLVDAEEREMIASVLEFRDTTAGEIMTPRTDVIGLDANLALAEAADIIIREGYSRYPVYEETIDKVIGMLYAKDLLLDLNHPDTAKGIRPRLRKPYFVPESKTVRDLLHDFQNQKVHMAVVLDEYGGTAGVVSIEDILEELVGEIVDEYEQPSEEPVKQIDENTLEVDARCHVDELNDDFNLDIPEDEDYDTVGGFAFAQLGHIPRSGESFQHENLSFQIVDVDQRRINRLRINILPKPTDRDNEKAKQKQPNGSP